MVRNQALLFGIVGMLVACSSLADEPVPSDTPKLTPSGTPAAAPSESPPGISTSIPTVPEKTSSSLNNPIPSTTGEDPYGRTAGSLTLEKSIQIALEKDIGILKAKNNVDATGSQLLQSYGQFLPNLVGASTASYQWGTSYFYLTNPTRVNTRNYGVNYQISSTINLFNGLSDFAGLKAELRRHEGAEMTLERAKQQIALDVSQTYLQVILDQKIVRIAEKNLAASQARQKLLQEQTRVGIRRLADLFLQQSQTSSDESYLINAQNKVRVDELLLLRKLQLDVDRNYQLEEPEIKQTTADPAYQNEAQLIKLALEQRLDLKAAQNLSDAAGWDAVKARSGYFPKIDLGLTVSSNSRILNLQTVNGTSNAVPDFQPGIGDQLRNQASYVAGVTLTWNVFDRFLTTNAVSQARIRSDNLELDAADRRKQVVQEVRQSLGDYRASLQQLDSTAKGLLAAQKAYEVMQGRYEVGSASIVDLLTARAALVQAEAGRAQALIGFALSSKAIKTVLGTS